MPKIKLAYHKILRLILSSRIELLLVRGSTLKWISPGYNARSL